ncbi:MAG: Calx-beta domain-containing protein [Bacteroidota bacterium]
MKKVLLSSIFIWISFSTALFAQETFRDNFSASLYSNNDGSQTFSGNWTEINDDGSPTGSRIRITGNELRFEDITRNSQLIQRSANLAGATSATLSFDWQTSGLDGGSGGEQLSVQMSNDGTNYTTIGTFTGTQSGSFSQDILAYASANSTIRFINVGTWQFGDWESNEFVFIDNVLITAVFDPSITIEDVSVDEDAGTVSLTATHSGPNTSGTFSVDYQTSNGSATSGTDYTASTGTINFSGTSGDTEPIVITILDDATFEAAEDFDISFTSSTDGSVTISDTATVTINDNDNDPNNPRPYEERVAINLMGNFKMLGNTNLLCTSGCPASPVSNNPSVVMGYADVDSDGVTVNSSSSTLNLPVGSTVSWAGLYWGGVYNSSYTGITNPSGALNIDQVKLMDPTSGSYSTINSDVRNIETTSFAGWNTFMAYADVTANVQAGGNGNYFVADIALATGSSFTGPHGGWTLVVIYSDPADTSRNVSVWDGFDFFGFGANDSFTVTGLLTPSIGSFETHVGYYGMDGEASSTGDFVSIEGTSLSNALNPATNILNGTISEFGVDLGTRNPNFGYSWGVDIDVFDATGLVANNATDMDVVLGSSLEGIWGGVFVTSNEIAFPTVATSSFSPDTVFQGLESSVTITIENPSNGVSLSNLALTNNLPTDMTIGPTPDASSSCGGTITAVPGSSSFIITGVSLPAGTTCSFTFDVVTSSSGIFTNTITPLDITNDQNIPLSGTTFSNLTVNPRPSTVITNREITFRVNPD